MYYFHEVASDYSKDDSIKEPLIKEKDRNAPLIIIDPAYEKSEEKGPSNQIVKEVEDTLKPKNSGQDFKPPKVSGTNQTPHEKIEEIRKKQEAKIYDREMYKKELEETIKDLSSLSIDMR